MALETSQKAKELINALHHRDHIDDMTKKWLYLTPYPPQIPVFYTLRKTHKPNAVRRLSDQAAKALMNESEVFEFPILTNRSPMVVIVQ